MNKQLLITAGTFAVGAGLGFGVGYLVFKKKFQAEAEREIDSVKSAFRKAAQEKPDIFTAARKAGISTGAPEVPEGIVVDTLDPEVRRAQDIASGESYVDEEEEATAEQFRARFGRVPSTSELVELGKGVSLDDLEAAVEDARINAPEPIENHNVFDREKPTDVGEEIEPPIVDVSKPHLINVTDYMTNEDMHDQLTLTYYESDDVLVDDAEKVIREIDEIVGEKNLTKWGYGSQSKDVVYVRNIQYDAVYEIIRNEGSYQEIVLGIPLDEEDRVKTAKVLRMRASDE